MVKFKVGDILVDPKSDERDLIVEVDLDNACYWCRPINYTHDLYLSDELGRILWDIEAAENVAHLELTQVTERLVKEFLNSENEDD